MAPHRSAVACLRQQGIARPAPVRAHTPATQTYPRAGKRIGAFYDAHGRPTAALARVRALAAEGRKQQVCVCSWVWVCWGMMWSLDAAQALLAAADVRAQHTHTHTRGAARATTTGQAGR
jgi:hypothetical protein